MTRTKASVLSSKSEALDNFPQSVIEPIARFQFINTTLHRPHPRLHDDAYNPRC